MYRPGVQERPPAAKLRPQVLLLGLISLLNDTASEMIYPLLPVFLVSTLGATPLIVGLIEGAADALASVLKLVAGSISDRLPARKPLVVGGYALATISRAWIGGASRWMSVLGARLLDRTGKGIRSAPRDAMIADVTEPELRGKAFGFQRALGVVMLAIFLREPERAARSTQDTAPAQMTNRFWLALVAIGLFALANSS